MKCKLQLNLPPFISRAQTFYYDLYMRNVKPLHTHIFLYMQPRYVRDRVSGHAKVKVGNAR